LASPPALYSWTVASLFGVDVDELLQLGVDEVGLHLLPDLAALDSHGPVIWNNARQTYYGQLNAQQVDEATRTAVLARIAAGWQWLRNLGYLSPHPDHTNPSDETVTEEGRAIGATGIADQRTMVLLRTLRLDRALIDRVIPIFRRGTYSAAVFQALLEVEDRVRTASGLRGDGVPLMKEAFGYPTGPLVTEERKSDQEAIMALFWGAMGVFRNEGGHHPLAHEEAELALTLVLFANALLRLVPDKGP
jgi:uncharacterized protein (TIGR02391 family)